MSYVNDPAVILARVSSKSQEDEGYSLESQVKLLESYCEGKGLEVAAVYKITESASKSTQRNIFKKTLKFIEDNGVKNLVIEKVDRHVRNLHDAVETHDWLITDENKKVHFVKDSLVLHKNSRSQEWLNWGIRVVMAKNYIDNLREEAMKGWAEKLAQGWLPAPPPPGYITIVDNGKRIHVPDPDSYKIIRKIFKLYLEPQSTVQTVTNALFRYGIQTRKGRPHSKSRVHKMLQNPFYISINRFDGKDYPGAQQTFISKDLFNAVQEKMHGGRPNRYRKHNPIFKGMIFCSHCEAMVTWQKQKGRYYGKCQRKTEECSQSKLIKEAEVLVLVEKMLGDLVSPSQRVIQWLTELLREDFKTEMNNRQDAVNSIKHRIKRLEKMDETLYDDKLLGEISVDRYKEKHKAFQTEIVDLKNKLGGVDHNYKKKYKKGITNIELSQVARERFCDENVDVDEKRDILLKLFHKIVVNNGSISVKYTKLAQAIASKSSETRRLYAKAKIA